MSRTGMMIVVTMKLKQTTVATEREVTKTTATTTATTVYT